MSRNATLKYHGTHVRCRASTQDLSGNATLNPRIFAKLIKGAPGAGSLLLNTKASQEAACSRAPAAIVSDREPEHAMQV